MCENKYEIEKFITKNGKEGGDHGRVNNKDTEP